MMMRIYWMFLTLLALVACENADQHSGNFEEVDTVALNRSDSHWREKSSISLKDQYGQNIFRFFSDSTYLVTAEHGAGVKMRLLPFTDNFGIERIDEDRFLLKTNQLDAGRREKIKIGFLTDTTRNLFFYTQFYINPTDSNERILSGQRIDTIATRELNLIGK